MERLAPFPEGNRIKTMKFQIATFVKGLPATRVRIVQFTARFLENLLYGERPCPLRFMQLVISF